MKKVKKKTKKKRIFKKHTNPITGKSWPHKPKNKKKVVRPTVKRQYKHRALTKLPEFYQANFMQRLDKRSELYYHLSTSYEQIIHDCGGLENISRLELSLVERLVFTEYLCRQKEVELLQDNDFAEDRISAVTRLGSLVQALAAKLGIVRRTNTTANLKEYLAEDKTE